MALCQAAHGGQVVLSEQAWSVVQDQLPGISQVRIMFLYQLHGMPADKLTLSARHHDVSSAHSRSGPWCKTSFLASHRCASCCTTITRQNACWQVYIVCKTITIMCSASWRTAGRSWSVVQDQLAGISQVRAHNLRPGCTATGLVCGTCVVPEMSCAGHLAVCSTSCWAAVQSGLRI